MKGITVADRALTADEVSALYNQEKSMVSADQTRPWWVVKKIAGRTVFYAGCDNKDEADQIAESARLLLPEERKDEITIHVSENDPSQGILS